MASPINVEVKLRPGETTDKLIRRFIKKVKREEVLEEVRERRYYVKPSEKKRKNKALRKKILKQLQENKEQGPVSNNKTNYNNTAKGKRK